MPQIDWSALLQTLLASAGQAVIAGLAGFAAALITFRFQSKTDVAKLEAESRRERAMARAEKRDEALEELWKKVIQALEKASISTAAWKQYPDFNRMSAEAASELLASSRLTERQRTELQSAPDPNKYYMNAVFWLELNDARRGLNELSASLDYSRVNVPAHVASTVDQLIQSLYGALSSYEISHDAPDHQLMKDMRSNIKAAQEYAHKTEADIRALLESEDASPVRPSTARSGGRLTTR
jgi:hypothetical protein